MPSEPGPAYERNVQMIVHALGELAFASSQLEAHVRGLVWDLLGVDSLEVAQVLTQKRTLGNLVGLAHGLLRVSSLDDGVRAKGKALLNQAPGVAKFRNSYLHGEYVNVRRSLEGDYTFGRLRLDSDDAREPADMIEILDFDKIAAGTADIRLLSVKLMELRNEIAALELEQRKIHGDP